MTKELLNAAVIEGPEQPAAAGLCAEGRGELKRTLLGWQHQQQTLPKTEMPGAGRGGKKHEALQFPLDYLLHILGSQHSLLTELSGGRADEDITGPDSEKRCPQVGEAQNGARLGLPRSSADGCPCHPRASRAVSREDGDAAAMASQFSRH